MAKNYSKVLLLTANVGSIFEEPEKMLPIWLKEFLTVVTNLQPEFLAIHCQEVGGKNYEESMQHVNKFIKMLLASEGMQEFDRARVFLDEDFTAVEKFTALGSLYFIHQSVKVVEIFDFNEKKFLPVEGKEVLSGNIEHVCIKEKAKFAKDFFPDSVWSRKGFIRTRWNLYNTLFDLVNIHLFHDVSNIAAMEKSPSVYSSFRERALLHTVERFENDEYDKVPFYIFGDFNFRLNTNQLVQHLTAQTEEHRITGKKNDISKVIYKQKDNGKIVLTVGKKDFLHCNHNDLFNSQNAMKLKKYDQEPEACQKKLFEYDVTFPPSYPFREDPEDGTSYMPTRCPGWCDRIMMSHNAQGIMTMENKSTPDYKMIGTHTCMGDHKPIYLNVKIRHRAGNEPRSEQSVLEEVPNEPKKIIPYKQVISINGEEVEASSLDQINIHDYTTFEKEDLMTEFMDTIKRRKAGTSSSKVSRFKEVARTVLHSESFLEAIKKHYSHRSDSEPDSEEEEKQSATKGLVNATLSLVGHAMPPKVLLASEASAANNPGDGVKAGAADTDLNTNANNSNSLQVSEVSCDEQEHEEKHPCLPKSDRSSATKKGIGSVPRNGDAERELPVETDKSLPHHSGASRRGCGCCRMQ